MEPDAQVDPPAIRVRMVALLRAAGPVRRLDLVRSLTTTTRAMSWSGLCRGRPDRSPEEQRVAYIELLYGKELAERLRRWQVGRTA